MVGCSEACAPTDMIIRLFNSKDAPNPTWQQKDSLNCTVSYDQLQHEVDEGCTTSGWKSYEGIILKWSDFVSTKLQYAIAWHWAAVYDGRYFSGKCWHGVNIWLQEGYSVKVNVAGDQYQTWTIDLAPTNPEK